MHHPVQAKDSDDDDDVTVTVDRDRFMDEFFEQVGASSPCVSLCPGKTRVATLTPELGPAAQVHLRMTSLAVKVLKFRAERSSRLAPTFPPSRRSQQALGPAIPPGFSPPDPWP